MLRKLINWWNSWEFDPSGTSGEEDRKIAAAKIARVNCIHLYPPKDSIPGIHCGAVFRGGCGVGDCPIYLGKSIVCSFRVLKIKPLTHNEILARVVEKGWVRRCVGSDICPYCGLDLEITGDNNFKECLICHKKWSYV